MVLTGTLGCEPKAQTDLTFTPTGLAYQITAPLQRLLISKHAARIG